jgi:hypothetical protein
MAWHFNYFFFLLENIQETKVKLIFLLFMLVELKLILMLLMFQPICEGCWWHWLDYIYNFLLSFVSLYWLDFHLNVFCNFCVVWFNTNFLSPKFIHVHDFWRVIINNLSCSTWSLIFSGHQVSTFLHGM